jgi:ribosome modulation factor
MSHHVFVSMDHQAWQVGYAAGLAGLSNINPPERDSLTFSSRDIEGKAHRQGFDAAGREKLASSAKRPTRSSRADE